MSRIPSEQHTSAQLKKLAMQLNIEAPRFGTPQPLSLPNLLDSTREAIEVLFPGTVVGIYTLSGPTGQLVLRSRSEGYLDHDTREERIIEPGEGLLGYVFSTREPLIVNDTSKSSQYRQTRHRTKSELVIPALSGKELVSVINIESDTLDAFTQRDVQILLPFAKILASGILYTRSHDNTSRFQQLVDYMNEAVWIGDRHERTVYANRKFQDLVEFDLQEMIGRESYEFWDEESAKIVRRANESDRTAGRASTYEGNLKSKSGKLIPVLLSGAPLPDGGTVGIMTDLRRLKETEARFKQLVEYMNEGVIIQNQHKKISYVNPIISKWLQYAPEDIIGKSVTDLCDEQARTTLNSCCSQFADHSPTQLETKLRCHDGTSIPVLMSCSQLPQGGTVTIVTDLREIREREMRVSELSKHDRFLASITHHSAEAIVGLDPQNIIVSWNKAAQSIFGHSKEEIIGKPITTIVPPDRVLEAKQLNERARRDGAVIGFETVRRNKQGDPINVSITETSLLDEAGDLFGYSVIYRDITLMKKRERELQIRFDRMQEAYRELGRQRRQVDYLVELIDVCIEHSPINRVADFVASAAVMLTHADACTLRLFDPEHGTLRLQATHGVGPDWYHKVNVPYEGSLIERAVLAGMPIKISDVNQDNQYSSHALAQKYQFQSALVLPLKVRSTLIGGMTLYLASGRDIGTFDDEFIPIFAKQAAITLDASVHDCAKDQ